MWVGVWAGAGSGGVGDIKNLSFIYSQALNEE